MNDNYRHHTETGGFIGTGLNPSPIYNTSNISPRYVPQPSIYYIDTINVPDSKLNDDDVPDFTSNYELNDISNYNEYDEHNRNNRKLNDDKVARTLNF